MVKTVVFVFGCALALILAGCKQEPTASESGARASDPGSASAGWSSPRGRDGRSGSGRGGGAGGLGGASASGGQGGAGGRGGDSDD
jgi:hypothetical protein